MASMSPQDTATDAFTTPDLGTPPDGRALPARQILSCIPCRKRKVKCDRTKPCSACCARGRPSECHFVVVDGSNYHIIQQSYEIRDLRSENKRLKEQLRFSAGRPLSYLRPLVDVQSDNPRIRRAVMQKRPRGAAGSTCDSQSRGASSLVELMKPQLITASSVKGGSGASPLHAAYPFPSLIVGDNTPAALTRLLPSKDDIMRSLEVFHGILQTLSIPQIPDRMRATEIEAFLSDTNYNASKEPGMLALLFAALALVLQESMDGSQYFDTASRDESVARKKCYIAASMQALRHASFMNEPDLFGIKTLLIIGLCLIKSGQLQDAWTMFGTIIRLAQSIGLHRDPDTLCPGHSPQERTVRRHIWWAMLYMDQHLSNMLCRPLGIFDAGNCGPPKSFATNPVELRLAAIVIESTIATREILSSQGCINSEKVEAFTERLLNISSTMPVALRLEESWLETDHSLPEWPLEIISAKVFADIQFLIMLLNSHLCPWTLGFELGFLHSSPKGPIDVHCHKSPGSVSQPTRNYRLMINGCIHVLRVFLFLWRRRSTTIVSHMSDSQALNAAMILVMDALETGNDVNLPLVDKTHLIFIEMKQSGGSQLSDLIVERLSAGLRRMRGLSEF